ncbi:MAG: DUF86 domain-containing protein [Syntrophales bacterium]
MTKAPIKSVIVTEKVAYIRTMIESIRKLPLSTFDDFIVDFRTPAAAESYLRRALESLFDLGRHILAKGFALAPAEYKQIAVELVKQHVLSEHEGGVLRQMAGYRNRMAHFYDEILPGELYRICRDDLTDLEAISQAFVDWLRAHPEKIDTTL